MWSEEQMRGMIWHLATDIAADCPEEDQKGRDPKFWVKQAEKYWKLGLRYEQPMT